APARPERKVRRTHQLFTISARSEEALNATSRRLAAHLRTHPEIDFADAAFTLHLRRCFFKHRRALVLGTAERERLLEALEAPDRMPACVAVPEHPTVLLFPGQGSQYPGMASGLYRSDPVVRRSIDRCARQLEPALGADLRKFLFPSSRN